MLATMGDVDAPPINTGVYKSPAAADVGAVEVKLTVCAALLIVMFCCTEGAAA